MIGFDDICGYESVKEHMKNAIREKRPAHAYIISGPRYSGKKTLTQTFAAALLCEKGGESPCMECISCKQVVSGNHPDLINVIPTKTIAISINDIREQLIDTISIAPYKSNYKIYIIDEAETMHVEAQNSLLKTLEEPPEYAVIILTAASKQKLIPTVLSRCVNLDLRPLDEKQIIDYLMKKKQAVDYQARMAAAISGGNLGKAIKLVGDPEFMELQNSVLDLLVRVKDCEPAELMEMAKKISDNKQNLEDLFDIMLLWYSDVLLYKATADANSVRFTERVHDLRRASEQLNYDVVQNIIETIEKSKQRIAANVDTEIVLELLLFAMKG